VGLHRKPSAAPLPAWGLVVLVGVIALGMAPLRAAQNHNSQFAQQIALTASSHRAPDASGAIQNTEIQDNDSAERSGAGGSLAGNLPAVSVNQQLSTNLIWSFGSKPQHGWMIYVPLICHIIKADSGITTDEFARSLSRWQASKGMTASGILDADTWGAMIRELQAHRIRTSQYPPPDRLVTVPASEFWDQTRPEELRQVERETYAAYKRLLSAAIADRSLHLSGSETGGLSSGEQYLKIISAFRPREYQDQLRRQSPNSDRAGLAINSPHFTGRALDLYVGGEPVSTKDDNRMIQTRTPVYRWLVKNALRFGFRPYFYEPWHWEYNRAG
jgi:zinc D-Ala-D-Ala carboxypeptidase